MSSYSLLGNKTGMVVAWTCISLVAVGVMSWYTGDVTASVLITGAAVVIMTHAFVNRREWAD